MGLPPGVTGPMSASGGCASVSLAEIASVAGANYFLSEQRAIWNSIITGAAQQQYQDWLVGEQKFTENGTTATDTGEISIQNLSGNTVERDMALAYAKNEFIGAYVYYRLWRADSERAIYIFTGNVVEVEIDDLTMSLHLEGFGNYSSIKAPSFNIDVSCPLYFGSEACASTSPTPCNQSYGDCSSIERFAGAVVQWNFSDGIAPLVQIAQPAPAVSYNPARAF